MWENTVRNVILWIYTSLAISLAWGQSPPIVQRVEWIGNEVTQDYILKREIQHPTGIPLDSSLAQDDRNRLYNLGIFSEVRWRTIPDGDGRIVLQYLVVESWRLMPGALPVYEEKSGWSLSGGLLINNFRGRNETLMIGGSVGGQNTLGIQYSNPWITGDHLSLDLMMGKDVVDHLFLPYEETTYYLGGKLGRYAGYTHKFKLSVEWNQSHYRSDERPEQRWSFLEIEGQYAYDTRDIYQEPTKGVLLSQTISPRLFSNGSFQWIWNQSLSSFKTVMPGKRPLILAGNFSSFGLMGFRDPIWLNYLGGSFTVRGFPVPDETTYRRGDSPERFGYVLVYGSMELRQIVIPRHATASQNEFGITAVAFVDAGIISDDVATLGDRQPLFGMGYGVRVPLPVLQVIRFDMGWGYSEQGWTGPWSYVRFGQKF